MLAPDIPSNEEQRLQALCKLQLLDTKPEERFDRFTRIAQSLFEVPIALISLVDSNRQWFKSRVGLEAQETARDISFCGHAILDQNIFYIQDALNDKRFSDNPLVTGPPHVRFYAGVPLTSGDGYRIGTLCLIDNKPRTMTDANFRTLQDLADCLSAEINQVKLRKTIAELAEQRGYTESILNTVTEGIIAIDRNGTVRSFNPAAERMFGYESNEVIGHSFKRLLPEKQAAELGQLLRDFLAGKTDRLPGIRQEVEGLRRDGTTFLVELGIGHMNISGEPMFNGIVRDITERRKLDRLKDEFISNVSHELRTPLTSIMGSLGLIRGGALGELPKEIFSMIDIAHSSSQRLVRLVNDILDLERLEAGHIELNLQPTNLVVLANLVIRELAGLQRKFSVRVELNRNGNEFPVVADPDQVTRAIINLVSNAIKFSPAGEVVTIELTRREDRLRLSVTDRGPGIPEEFHEELFHRFTQADPLDCRTKGGTGLGLSIVKAIVESHHGEVGFVTSPDTGTTIYFDLPEKLLHPEEDVSKSESLGRILICEDDGDVANLLALVLKNAGFESNIAATVKDARQKLAASDYDAMTLDLCLPDGDGISLINELKRDPRTKNLPIVVVSANIDQQARQLEGAVLGVVEWIPKPIDLEQVVAGVSKAVKLSFESEPSVLHVEDDPSVSQVLQAMLGPRVKLVPATTLAQGRKLMEQQDFDLVILDLALPDGSGDELLPRMVREDGLPIPVVILSGEPASRELARRVSANLVKSRTSSDRLVQTILTLLRKYGQSTNGVQGHGTGATGSSQ